MSCIGRHILYSSTRGLRPPEQLERPAGFPSSDKTRHDSPDPTLQGPCRRSPKPRGSLRFLPPLEMRPSSIAPNPAESRGAPPPPQDPSPLRGTLGSSLRSPADREIGVFQHVPPPTRLRLEFSRTTRGGTGNPVHRPENPAGSTYSSTTGLSPLKQ